MNQLEQKKAQLQRKKEENLSSIEEIKSLKESIQVLKWKIPSTGVEDDIEELKQSIRIPSFVRQEEDKTVETLMEDLKKSVAKEAEAKMIKCLENRREVLQKLDKLKPEGNLYQSHRRVILKQYLEQLRETNLKSKEMTSKLQSEFVDIEVLKNEYENVQKELGKSSGELEVSRLM